MDKFKIASLQMKTEEDLSSMLCKMNGFVEKAALNGADVAVLPEMWSCPYATKYFVKAAQSGHEAVFSSMAEAAARNGIILVGGSVPECSEGRLYNSCFVFDRNGELLAKHRKIHLFDVDLPEMHFKESATFTAGSVPTVINTEFGCFGVAICFDVRFPELFRLMANRGAEVIFLPAQFNMTTGPAHWETTLRARAIDNQLFLAACSAARNTDFSYNCYGHSMTVDPFGRIISSCKEEETIIYSEIDKGIISQTRNALPTHLHLRDDIYAVAK